MKDNNKMVLTVDTFLDSIGFSGELKREKARHLIVSFLAFIAYIRPGDSLEVDGLVLRRLDEYLYELEGAAPNDAPKLLVDLLSSLPGTKAVKLRL